jgi:hypothetical protein
MFWVTWQTDRGLCGKQELEGPRSMEEAKACKKVAVLGHVAVTFLGHSVLVPSP